jgi:hypothetical protein
MGGLINSIGEAISGLFDNVVGAVVHVVSTIVHTADGIIPGGFPVFIVLCAIAILVGLATFRR